MTMAVCIWPFLVLVRWFGYGLVITLKLLLGLGLDFELVSEAGAKVRIGVI